MKAIKHTNDRPETPSSTTYLPPAKTKYVRAEVLAEALDVHKRTVALWAEKKLIPSIRIGGVLRFDFQAVMEAAR